MTIFATLAVLGIGPLMFFGDFVRAGCMSGDSQWCALQTSNPLR